MSGLVGSVVCGALMAAVAAIMPAPHDARAKLTAPEIAEPDPVNRAERRFRARLERKARRRK